MQMEPMHRAIIKKRLGSPLLNTRTSLLYFHKKHATRVNRNVSNRTKATESIGKNRLSATRECGASYGGRRPLLVRFVFVFRSAVSFAFGSYDSSHISSAETLSSTRIPTKNGVHEFKAN